MMASTSSMTSKYASLFVYLTPDRLQGTFDNCPVGNVSLTLKMKMLTILGYELLEQVHCKHFQCQNCRFYLHSSSHSSLAENEIGTLKIAYVTPTFQDYVKKAIIVQQKMDTTTNMYLQCICIFNLRTDSRMHFCRVRVSK